jgi:hypothetical protein
MNSTSTLILVGAICLIVGGAAGYFGGQHFRQQMRAGQFANRQGGAGQFRNAAGGNRPLIGQILNVGSDRLTVQTPDGSSHIVIIGSTTTFNKVTDGTISDFPSGSQVMVLGSQGSDGTVTATSISQAPPRTNR